MVENLLLRLAVLTCGLSCAALPAAAADPAIRPPARFVEVPATQQTLQSLRGGGFVLYLRHGHTAVSQSGGECRGNHNTHRDCTLIVSRKQASANINLPGNGGEREAKSLRF